MRTELEDVLLIHYRELATSSEERLYLLALIGELFNKPPGYYNLVSLNLAEKDWQALSAWIEGNHSSRFWFLIDTQGVRVLRTCESHILIGTAQLLTDLAVLEKKSSLRPTIDDIWIAARNFGVRREAPLGKE